MILVKIAEAQLLLRDMKLPEETKYLCKLHGIKPSRSRGQNFLHYKSTNYNECNKYYFIAHKNIYEFTGSNN